VPFLVGLLVVVPLLELYVLIQVGQVIGAGWTVLALVLMSVLGAALLKREGTRAYRSFRTAAARGGVPAKETADGALVLLGGALLLTPGFVTDVFGVLLVLPPTRAVVRRSLMGLVLRRLGAPGLLLGLLGGRARGRPRRGSSRVVEGEVVQDPRDPSA
jgi:UPF0716 protein FxsA